MGNRSRPSEEDRIVRRELSKQVAHAILRPKKRVWIGKYLEAEGEWNVYVQVEKAE
jgi:hypothetical protein